MVENPKYKSDIPMTTKGIRVPTILFLKVVELNNAMAVIGAKFGGCGTNLNKIANTTNNKIRYSLFIIYYLNCGLDETRTRDPLRDRQVF